MSEQLASLSARGQRAATQPIRADFDLFRTALENLYHPQDNPAGVFTLCIAENLLNWEEMRAKLQSIASTRQTPDWVASYTSILGAPDFRAAATRFLGRMIADTELNPECLAVSAGATATIEMTALLLGDPDDVVVIPGPAYMAYTPDVANKAGLQRYNLHHLAPSSVPGTRGRAQDPPAPIQPVYELTTDDLDRAYATLGDRFRMLVLTQPNNPTGQVFSAEQLRDFTDWCTARRIHLVVNEIYALSRFNQDHPALAADFGGAAVPFTSFLSTLESRKSPYLHWWYSFSKDFGISGLRMGLLYTHNAVLLKSWANFGAPSVSSNYPQWLLSELLDDTEWVTAFVTRNATRLTESYAAVVTTLRAHGIPYAPAVGSLFVWLDLSSRLEEDSDAAELALWQEVYDQTGILLTSPVGMGNPSRGWYRMVYSCVPLADLKVAMQRLGQWLGEV
ncbi:aminotransferase class I/II-fold pyridoxal phosphate-dependent enzyme [Neolewinella lacunae]|uniref:Aminotransferase n=1 Tax=Neolewinella lacunae TaxID=1517758 RepID=A0A923PI57_9BACT|nr:aminotransferase class I/II-fold pyridoxal phosphate-dependent enzyme [Neolewinella lacunae]MBC6994583.1 aminotransferase class I/II-fold pyridoxal phosphate-dependent enzyme [Neolewinella lacunae]MDN3634455.1 aminotransferase class I/II-fold pyridoxal phosphate-dependent enzyme [Neolewinella lacunae]